MSKRVVAGSVRFLGHWVSIKLRCWVGFWMSVESGQWYGMSVCSTLFSFLFFSLHHMETFERRGEVWLWMRLKAVDDVDRMVLFWQPYRWILRGMLWVMMEGSIYLGIITWSSLWSLPLR